ncbi:MAG: T9SS type A sorting domain-containing protein [Ignavibacteria bacterium]|jgi:hypothetical protein|nr:T9SS type A sorting domain-containing protein [Ignavibacteria bacterium]
MKIKITFFVFFIFINQLFAYPDAVMQQVQFTGNNICTYFNNFGVFNQNFGVTGLPGLTWHCNQTETYCFTSGLSACAYINGVFGMFSCSWKGELAPGFISGDSLYITNPDFKIYRVTPHDSPWQNPDFANWYKMVPFGAPYEDFNGNCIFEPGIDRPGVPGSEQTIFVCMTDLDIANHIAGEGFGGGIVNPLLYAEVRMTAWGYDLRLPDVMYIKYEIINKGKYSWDSAYFSMYCDPDIMSSISPTSDYTGCDTSMNLGFAYGSDTVNVYGAYGMRLLRGPVNRETGDTLYMTSFTHNKMPENPCENTTSNPYSAYNSAKGYKPDLTPYMNPVFTPPARTKFIFSGDPESNTGWTPKKGYILNCGGNDTGTFLPVFPENDRMFLMNTGAGNLRILPADTQRIFFSQMIAQGTTNLNSVTKLKTLSYKADLFFREDIEKTLLSCQADLLPGDYTISQNYPNPFNNSTTIQFTVPRNSYIKIVIYDLLGREIARPVDGQVPAGYHEVNFSASDLASGVYFYRMIAVDNTVSSAIKPGKFQKMVLIK